MGEQRDAEAAGDLVAAVTEGDRTAFELHYRHYAPWLTARLRYRCADAALLDDVLQETFLDLWRTCAAGRQAEVADMSGWLWRVASRRLVDQLRAGGTRQRLHQALGRLRGREQEPSVEERVLSGVEHGDLADALARLPAELSRVMRATVLDGLTVRQTAALLGIAPGTVKTRAMRARKLLRQELEEARPLPGLERRRG